MHIVFIVGSYYPSYSAVGKCVGNVVDEISKSHQVTIICGKSYVDQKSEEIYKGQKIIRVMTQEKKIRFDLDDKIKINKGCKKNIYEIILNIYKFNQRLKLIFSKTTIKKNLVASYINALSNIKEPFDVIIPASMPFESVLAAVKYKNNIDKNIKVVPYLFDQFVNNKSLHNFKWNLILKRKQHRKIEQQIVTNVNNILILKQLEYYYEIKYKNQFKKFYIVEHPLLREPIQYCENKKKNIVFMYAGSFYKSIRNPEYMLKSLNTVINNLQAKLELYTFGNCNELVNKYTLINKNIINYGKVSTEKVHKELINADFLVAVGNTDNTQVPSKIFEYLSFGKPILYFYSNDLDTNIEVLNKYPLAICIKQDYNLFDSNLYKIEKFCKDNLSKRMMFEEVSQIFSDATPRYTVDLIENILCN